MSKLHPYIAWPNSPKTKMNPSAFLTTFCFLSVAPDIQPVLIWMFYQHPFCFLSFLLQLARRAFIVVGVCLCLWARRRPRLNYLAADGISPEDILGSATLQPSPKSSIAFNFFFGQFELFSGRGRGCLGKGTRGIRGDQTWRLLLISF